MAFYNNVIAGAAGAGAGAPADLKIERSLRFNSGDGAYLSRTPSSAGNRNTWTLSWWMKRSKLSNNFQTIFGVCDASATYYTQLRFGSTDKLSYQEKGSANGVVFETDMVFRDTSAWYHCVFVFNNTASSNSEKARLYVNGSEITDFSTDNRSQIGTTATAWNNNVQHNISHMRPYSGSFDFDGYLADVHFIDGQALAPTAFGEFDTTTGVWNPIAFTGSHGTNGFRLDFSDNSSDAALGTDSSGNSNTWTVNNLSAGAAVPNKGYNVVLYTGTGASQTVGGLAFQPDLVWIKSRGSTADHELYDSVRGATKRLFPSLNNGESTNTNGLTGFTSNGFTLGGHGGTNGSGTDYVAWSWKAGGSTTTTNNDGNISSQVSVNTAYGFSIVKYTGNGSTSGSVGHGLGSTPKFVIVKNLSTGDWKVRHTSMGSTQMASLNENYLANTASWNGETSSVFYPARSGDTYLNVNTEDYIAYCWSEVAGFSKFGSWTGTGVGGSSGPVITLGFKPRWVLMKRTDQSGDSWTIFDTARDSDVLNIGLYANTSDSELTFGNRSIQVSDTGFQVTSTGSSSNASGGTYIYAAFADGDSTGIDSLLDTPTNYEASSGNNGGNYATLNPLAKGSAHTLSNGNLDFTMPVAGGSKTTPATMGVSSGKWYWEMNVTAATTYYPGIGIDSNPDPEGQSGDTATGLMYLQTGAKFTSSNLTAYGASYAAGDVIAAALDMDGGTITFYKNGVSQGQAFAGITGKQFPVLVGHNSAAGSLNYGQRPFAYTPPTGFVSLCTQNLDGSTYASIADGSTAFDVVTYSSDGSSRTISGLNMSPDLVWSKRRSSAGRHVMSDSVRGVNKELFPNLTEVERTSTDGLTAFNSNGYTLGNDSGQYGWQANNTTFVNWAWDAGSSNTSISVGGLNSSFYNQGSTNYTTSQVTGNDYSWSSSATNGMFDGQRNTIRAASSQNTFTWNTSIALTTLRLMVHKEGGTTTINITDSDGQRNIASLFPTTANSTVTNGGLTFVNVPVRGTLTQIEVNADPSGVGYQAGIAMVEIDGKVLVDNGVTPPNVPSIASTVRANSTAGFSIVSWTGTGAGGTIGHGLNTAPEFLIVKNRDGAHQWPVYSKVLGPGNKLQLQDTAASANTGHFNSLDPTSSVFSVGSTSSANANGDDIIAYCFAPVEGYSAFGSYEGDGNANGPFVYLGFRPAFVMIKNADAAGDWSILDTTRDPYNRAENYLPANDSGAETSGYFRDYLSNGFKIRDNGTGVNTNNQTYLYVAFAEHPFKTARAR